MDGDSLAVELLSTLKTLTKKLYAVIVILVILLFATNIAWLYAWNLPSEDQTSTQSYEVESNDSGNAVYSEEGGVDINGKN